MRTIQQATEADLRLSVITCGRVAYERRLLSANDGNISVRLDSDKVLITPSGICKGRMSSEDLLVIGLDGEVFSAPPGRIISSETPMHLEVYKQRLDARAVLHAHPVFATALTVAKIPFPADVLPEVLLTLGDVPTTRYATPSSHDDADAIRELIRTYDAILLCQHGSLTIGADLEIALTSLERIEHVAEVYWRAQMLGTVTRITIQDQQRLMGIRAKIIGSQE